MSLMRVLGLLISALVVSNAWADTFTLKCIERDAQFVAIISVNEDTKTVSSHVEGDIKGGLNGKSASGIHEYIYKDGVTGSSLKAVKILFNGVETAEGKTMSESIMRNLNNTTMTQSRQHVDITPDMIKFGADVPLSAGGGYRTDEVDIDRTSGTAVMKDIAAGAEKVTDSMACEKYVVQRKF